MESEIRINERTAKMDMVKMTKLFVNKRLL